MSTISIIGTGQGIGRRARRRHATPAGAAPAGSDTSFFLGVNILS